MTKKIIEREKISLNQSQTKLLISGWGDKIIKNSEVEKITYISDGLKIKGYLAYPKNFTGKNFPCVMWNRGGYLDKGAIDKFTARGMYGQIASLGYCVFASQYRGNAGSEGKEELGGNDVNDILNLMEAAKEVPFADSDNWAMEGWSRGGMMTYLTLLRNKNFWENYGYPKCAILVAAISNVEDYAKEKPDMMERYINIVGKNNYDEEIKKRSVMGLAENLPDIPYLMVHGGKDETVSVQQTLKIAEKFNEIGRKYRLVIFEDGDHYLKNYRKEMGNLRKEWLDKYLKRV